MKIINLIAYENKGPNQNIGDLFSSLALKDSFKTKKDSWRTVNFHKTVSNLDNYDLVIVGGGGLINPGQIKVLTKNSNIQNTSTPTIFLGVGLNLDKGQKYSKQDILHLKKLTATSRFIGSRDQLTKTFLDKLKIKNSLVGWPSSIYAKNLTKDVPQKYDYGFNFALHHSAVYQKNAGKTLKLISLVKRISSSGIVICHSKFEKRIFQRIFKDVYPVFYSNKPNDVFNIYKQCKMVVGMRGHSQIFALGVNTPSMPISLNDKVSEPLLMLGNYKKYVLDLECTEEVLNQRLKEFLKELPSIKKKQRDLISKLEVNYDKVSGLLENIRNENRSR